MLVRPETEADRAEVLTLTGIAFASAERPDEVPVEVGLYDRLFHCAEYIPDLSLVAEDGGLLIGSVITTRAWVDDAPVLGLGPIGVLPHRQRAGVGAALINTSIEIAVKRQERGIFLLGSTDYYPRFGFSPASGLGVTAPEPAWGDHFQGLILPDADGILPDADGGDATGGTPLAGKFRYAEPFKDL